jgi:NAD(P)-dependent dehydrogenase (short-subunit alcohol dehydrogenase family)
MVTTYDYSGRTVLVTGGSRGFGAAIAAAFLCAGAQVIICARHEPDKLPSGGGKQAWFIAADVRRPDEVDRLITSVFQRAGRLDVLVNNAGGTPVTLAADTPPSRHAKIIELNLTAALHVSQRSYQVMRDQAEGGAIIMIGSSSGIRPSPGTAAYGAAKAGLHHLAACLAAEWAPDVRVNTVIVGLADSGGSGAAGGPGVAPREHFVSPGKQSGDPSAHYGGPAGMAAIAATVPAGRLATPQDVAGACLYLAAPSYVTGASLLVHGGGETPAWTEAAWTHSADAAVPFHDRGPWPAHSAGEGPRS